MSISTGCVQTRVGFQLSCTAYIDLHALSVFAQPCATLSCPALSLPYCTLACRPDIVVPFMDYLADQGVVQESSTLLVAWLDLLTGMASGPKGASTVFGSLCMDISGEYFLDALNSVRFLSSMHVFAQLVCLHF